MSPAPYRLLLGIAILIVANVPGDIPSPTAASVLTENIQRQQLRQQGK